MFYFQTMFQQVYNGITGRQYCRPSNRSPRRSFCWPRSSPCTRRTPKEETPELLRWQASGTSFMGLLISQYPERFQKRKQRLRQCCAGDRADGRVDEFPRPGPELPFGEHWPGSLVELGRRRRGRRIQPDFPGDRGVGLSRFRTPSFRSFTACTARFCTSLGRWCWRCTPPSVSANWQGRSW